MFRVFKNSISKHNKIFYKKSTPEKSKQILKKLQTLKPLLEINYENPSQLLKKNSQFGKIEKNSIIHTRIDKSISMKGDTENISNPNTLSFNYSEISKPLIKFVFVIFTIYYFYLSSFFVVFYSGFNQLKSVVEFNQLGSTVDKSLMSNILMTKVVMLTNITDDHLYEILDGVAKKGNSFDKQSNNIINTSGFIRNQLDTLYKKQEQMEVANDMYKILSNLYDTLDCEYVYSKLNDTVYLQILDMYKQANLTDFDEFKKFPIHFCEHFKLLQKTNDTLSIIVDELLYSNKRILDRYYDTDGDYKKIKALYDEKANFDLSFIFNYVLRPVEGYVRGEFAQMVTENNSSYMSIIMFYLSFNILVEIVLFSLIHKYLNNRIIATNERIYEFIGYV